MKVTRCGPWAAAGVVLASCVCYTSCHLCNLCSRCDSAASKTVSASRRTDHCPPSSSYLHKAVCYISKQESVAAPSQLDEGPQSGDACLRVTG